MTFRNYKTGSLITFTIVLYTALSAVIKPIKGDIIKASEPFPTIIETLGMLSVPAIMTLVFIFIDKFAWKWKVLNWLIDIPNLSGRYEGYYTSSIDNYNKKYLCAFEVRQTASKTKFNIFYEMETDGKIERMLAYSILEDIKKDDDRIEIKFIYANHNLTTNTKDITPFGASAMDFDKTAKILKGIFWNKRPHNGDFQLNFKSTECKGSL